MDRPEKKNRLSRLLGKRDKSQEPPAIDPDSAYASSETPSRDTAQDPTPHATPDFVPAEKNSDIANIDRDRNLEVKPSTGEVRDQDTGELVTVVTTTTTTTTTTTRKPGGNPEVHKDVKQDVQETTPTARPRAATPPPTSPGAPPSTAHSGLSEMPANPASRTYNTATMTHANPPIKETTVPDRTSSRPLQESPPIPTRSAARKSGEFGNRQPQASNYPGYNENLPPPTGGFYGSGADMRPASPASKHNFSYPRHPNSGEPERPAGGLGTTEQPQQHNKSTMNDLKAAAKGIHGIGETLRGTLNSTIDDRFPRQNVSKAAYAHAKNEEVLVRGRTEMSHIPQREKHMSPPQVPHSQAPPPQMPPSRSPAPPIPPPNPRTKTDEQVVPGSWSEGDDHLTKQESPAAYGGEAEQRLGDRELREDKKARSIGKLFKRKPVGKDNEGGLRVTNP